MKPSITFYSQGMGTTPNHINHIPKPILHHHLLAEVVYRIRLLPNLQIQITYETKKINQGIKRKGHHHSLKP